MKKSFLAILLGVLLVFSITGIASATLIGDVVNISHTPMTSNVTVTDDASDLWNFVGVYTVDVNSASISINFLTDQSFKPGNVLTISGLDTPLLDVDSTYANTSFGSDRVSFDFSGVAFTSGSSYFATLSFDGASIGTGGDGYDSSGMHSPIPAPILLLGTGLVGLAGFRRRIKK